MKTTQRVLSDPGSIAAILVAGIMIAVIIISATPSWGHPNHTCHWHSTAAHCR